ncbi:hypothetical protein LG634_17090 [Streptomyces bambusae]|uniref:hypothetical protein n=1 Tax=Streptomyces bambusae TaxID=1550616 RepID=UPI001CFE4F7B|nr:hypothetical protein [Streptomyces bambusae]MCB5166546.1 hypothetical protein [Streptomyces bambusae]
MVELERVVASIKGIERFPGMERAWRRSPLPIFVFSLALDADGDRIYQLNTRNSFDAGLVRAVLEFARERRVGLGEAPRPFDVVPGFSYPGYGFDVVVAVPPPVHGYYVGEYDELHEAVVGVFPAYRCEFAGDETLEEAVTRRRMLDTPVMNRRPVPYLRMRYDNTRTLGGSEGNARGFTTYDVLLREIPLLEGAPGSFVEFENRHGEIWRIEWDGAWSVNGEVRDHAPSETWVMTALDWPE